MVRLYLQHSRQGVAGLVAVMPINTASTQEHGTVILRAQILIQQVMCLLKYKDREQVAQQVQDVQAQPGSLLPHGQSIHNP